MKRQSGYSKAKRRRSSKTLSKKQRSRKVAKKRANGKYVAKTGDRRLRVLMIPTPEGPREIAVRGSHEATVVGRYWAAVQKYLQTGDESALRRIRRAKIKSADGKRIRLIKDVAELDRLGSAGVLSFESVYARAA